MKLPGETIFEVIKVGIDKIFPDPAKKAEAQALLLDAQQRGDIAEMQFETADEQERTKRHSADMKSDNWLSKNIRPLSLVFLLFVSVVLAVTDGNLYYTANGETRTFTIQKEYIKMYQALLLMAFGFYFTSRGLEKLMTLFGSRQK